ncbi:MAG: glycosyltransferase family 2 protein [Cephaloticoccus sp.]|nr:glycosyltransferase family 2 protein [Cephaloticoccus sp.]
MQVSFIIPLFNCLALTRAMLASLQATLPPDLLHEIILVDDGSTDGTREWLSTLKEPCRVLLNKRNVGYAAANNRGAAIARGDALILLNNDLLLTPGWLEPILRTRRRFNPRSAIIGNVQLDARTGTIDHTGMIINLKGKPEHDHSFPPGWWRVLFPVRESMAVTGACLLIDRQLWRQMDGFDEAFQNGGEDVDLCLRARAAGHRTVVNLRSVIQHHVSSSPGRKLHDERNSLLLAKKWRDEFAVLGARRWCWDYLHRRWTTPHPAHHHAEARQALFYALHLRDQPPPVAMAGMHTAIDHEFSRWQRLLAPPSS